MRHLFQIFSCTKKGFSVICVYNNRQKLNDFPFESFMIDNTANNIKSAARILNETARKARYEYLMFVHQDVTLYSHTWLADAYKDLGTLQHLGSAGVAGKNENGLVASVTHGNPPFFVGPERLTSPIQVQTLDGCLMIVPLKIFRRISFDEKTIQGWYLYVVDYCLDLVRRGYRNYVLPHQIYHESTGPSDLRLYENTLNNIIQKHRSHTPMIYSTMGEWKTC